MYVLPTRPAFMTSIGESEETARGPAGEFVAGAAAVEAVVLALFPVQMPASDAAPASMFSSSSWWGTPAAAPAPS